VTRVTRCDFRGLLRVDLEGLPLIQKRVPLAKISAEETLLPGTSMQLILQQIEELLIGAIPTAVLFILLVFSYQFLVQGPLTAVLAKRRALTVGAMEDARNAIAQAEAKTAEYAEKLRQARSDAYKAREQRVKQWNADRDAALDAARKSAGDKVRQARAEIETEAAAARKTIQAAVAELAGQAVRAVLPAVAGSSR